MAEPNPETVEKVADKFADVLRGWLSTDQWVEMQQANIKAAPGVCASHDYCDANMAMHEAICTVLGRDPIIEDETNGADEDALAMDDNDIDLWNKAWEVAMKKHLTAGVH